MCDRNNTPFFWSDNWWVEGNMAWFVAGEHNMLFRIDMNQCRCEFVATLPDYSINGFRLHTRCIKCNDKIFCMPDLGKCIWVYQLENREFQQIDVFNPEDSRLSIVDFWEYGGKIFAITMCRKIIEIDTQNSKIDKYYDIAASSDEMVFKSIVVGKSIYSIVYKSLVLRNKITKFDMETKVVTIYELSDIEDCLQTLCFDGTDFWLSGNCETIYRWSRDSNEIEEINIHLQCKEKNVNFTEEMPMFLDAIDLGCCIWFLPLRAGKIVCVNKDTKEVFNFEIEDEEEDSYRTHLLLVKYLREYVRENRYLGLFDLKSNSIVEIDAVEKTVKWKKYALSDECIAEMLNVLNKDRYDESKAGDKYFFGSAIKNACIGHRVSDTENIGIQIFEAIKKENK